ncbi:methyl-accepting chemotaxis protein [Sporomusa acidovorans]|uniref:Methyl-accepting chemotaxis protein McpA n=1 Tax=Sporomusa acidovorans (strain ATCC 49682 / DSM 3132 / Mol) TaxID=1123286 RepID=A0ABZ3J0X2_SPOA4|nr:methyl-accepting chemotaxis protein [Sporomusa acidovorans]OZC21319.1 methyl-accepting chemotaxis protein McpA [Sporomusa acidovorans DSM 3132]SDE57453.1 methyl-accepting chemotaxis sensory transducer with Cache sensor [Sporomusa acidovorans]
MNSIKAKLIAVVLTLMVVTLGLMGSLSYWQAKKVIVKDIENEMTSMAENRGQEIGMWLNIKTAEIEAMARSPIMSSGDEEGIMAYFASEMQRNKMYHNIMWLDLQGNCFDSRNIRGNLAEREYFQTAVQGKLCVSDPIFSRATGESIIVIAAPIQSKNQVVGVLVCAINIGALENVVEGVKIGETGYAFLVRKDGLTVLHPNKEVANNENILQDADANPKLKAAVTNMVNGEKGIAEYQNEGVSRYLAYAPVAGVKWSVGVNVPVREMTAKLNTFTWISLCISICAVIIAAFVIIILSIKIAKPLQALTVVANHIAGGDLRETQIGISSNDEVGKLARSFEKMGENLHQLLRRIEGSALQVSTSTEELTANAEQSAQAATQVANAIAEVADGTYKQVAAIEKSSVIVEQMLTSIQQVSASSQTVAGMSDKTAAAATEGSKAIEKAVNQMVNIEQTVNSSASVISSLGERSQEIGQIINTISGIASQTNLLALNAAIEAARAGEQGRGFAVVAEEVRKLAEQSQDAAKQIEAMIGEIQSETGKAVASMNQGTQEVKIGTEVVSTAGKAFEQITGLIGQVSCKIREIAAAIQQMAGDSHQVVDSVQEIDKISKNTASHTQTVSAATEEQSASMEEIAASSQALAQMADELLNAVKKFQFRSE